MSALSATSQALDPEHLVASLFSDPQPEDPYPLYAALRASEPIFRSATGMTFLSRYDDCQEAIRTPSLVQAGPVLARTDPRFGSSTYLQTMAGMLIFSDPPEHTRLRSLVNRAFTPRIVAGLRPAVETMVRGEVDRLAEIAEFDLVAEMTNTLPARTICALVGVPGADHQRVVRWADDISIAASTPSLPTPVLESADRAVEEFHDYLDALIAERRATPRDDLLSALSAVAPECGHLEASELKSFVVNILAAGTETTTHLISVGLLTLLRHPTELESLRADQALLGPAIEEILRYEPPVQMAFVRRAPGDVRIGDADIEEGTVVAALIGAANHDPAAYDDPDTFQIRRPPVRSALSFGSGPHFCIGAALARLQADAALSALLQRFPTLDLAGIPEWRNSIVLRGLRQLPLRGTPR